MAVQKIKVIVKPLLIVAAVVALSYAALIGTMEYNYWIAQKVFDEIDMVTEPIIGTDETAKDHEEKDLACKAAYEVALKYTKRWLIRKVSLDTSGEHATGVSFTPLYGTWVYTVWVEGEE